MYFNTLVNERKHKDAKSIAHILPVAAGTGFDISVNRRLLMHQVQGLIEHGDSLHDERVKGNETDVTDQLGPVLRPHLAAAQVIAGIQGPPASTKHFSLLLL